MDKNKSMLEIYRPGHTKVECLSAYLASVMTFWEETYAGLME